MQWLAGTLVLWGFFRKFILKDCAKIIAASTEPKSNIPCKVYMILFLQEKLVF